MEADQPARRRKATFAERRDRRAAVEDVGEVLDAAARYLEARPRSVAEVRRRLTTAGYRPDLVEAAVERLVDLQYLDDDAFARAWVESRDRARPRGEHALRRELQLKGVERSLIDTVLEERRDLGLVDRAVAGDGFADRTTEGVDDAAAARLLRRRGPSLLREADPRRRRAKAYALLARNGFTPDVCAAAATAWLAGDDPGEGS